jgi:hypothetical protein
MERCKKYGGHLAYDLYRFARPCLWTHLHYYTARVSGAYKRRHSILEARLHLGTLLKESREAGIGGYDL